MTSLTTSKVVETFRQLVRVPTPCGVFARQIESGIEVETLWTQRDLEKKESTKFVRNYFLPKSSSQPILQVGRPVDVSSELWRVYSKSGDKFAILRKVEKDKEKEERQMIEVWNRDRRLATVDVAAQEKHGKVYADDHVFGSFQFSDCESYLLYIAEKKKPKFETFFDPFGKPASSKPESSFSSSSKPLKGEKYTYVEEWGEQLVGKSHPVICLLRVSDGIVKVLDDNGDFPLIPPSISPGQAVWIPATSTAAASPPPLGIVFVGFDHSVERLGIIYCPMRASRLYYTDLTEVLASALEKKESAEDPQSMGREAVTKKMKAEESTLGVASSTKATPFGPSGISVRSPRFSPDGSSLIFLENPAGGPHHQAAKLMSVSFDGREFPMESLKTIVDVVRSPTRLDQFQGIYSIALPRYCWDVKGRIWLNTIGDCHVNAIIVDSVSGAFSCLEKSTTTLGVFGDIAFTTSSSSYVPPSLYFQRIADRDVALPLELCHAFSLEDYDDALRKLVTGTAHVDSALTPTIGPNIHYSSILSLPSPTCHVHKHPLIVFPHGGPHSAFTDDWSVYIAGFLQSGFAVLKVNYRGSVGRGQSSIEALPGHIGDYDVKDVHEATLKALKDYPDHLDASQVVVFGGSHGGFLTAHLIGQYPDFYKVAVCRNPVINLTNMLGVTDIPDWTLVEGITSGMDHYRAGVVPTADQFKELISRSPISYAHKVKSPTLILLGMKDLRVPPSQGIQLYKALKARGVTTELKMFPEDCHSLSKIETEAESFVLIVEWFLKHLGLLREEEV